MSLDITPDFKQRTIAGQVTFTFKPIAKPLAEMDLNAADMTIVSVESSEKIQAWQVNADRLLITFAAPIPADKESRISIRYTAQPKRAFTSAPRKWAINRATNISSPKAKPLTTVTGIPAPMLPTTNSPPKSPATSPTA